VGGFSLRLGVCGAHCALVSLRFWGAFGVAALRGLGWSFRGAQTEVYATGLGVLIVVD